MLKVGDTFSLEQALALWGKEGSEPPRPILPPAERPMSSFWHVAFVQPKCEKRAVEALLEAGFQAYGPLIKIDRQVSRRCRKWKTFEMPMFPRYVFVGGDRDVNGIKGVDGVVDYLRDGDRAAVVPVRAIEDLQVTEDMGLFNKLRGQTAVFEVGEHVRIVAGIFSGFPAVVQRALVGQPAEVLIEIMGRCSRAEIPVEALRRNV